MPRDDGDEQLMEAFRHGDAGAFEVLLRRHRAPVFTFLVRLTADRGRAEDLLQETWMRVVGAAPRWEPRATFRTWLFTVARNLAADEARRAAHRRTEPMSWTGAGAGTGEGELGGLARTLRDTGPAPDRGAQSALLRPKLAAALESLPPDQREVFVLREYAGVPFAEIAEITGAPEPTVKSRMRYALEGLRRRLAELGVGPEDAAAPETGT